MRKHGRRAECWLWPVCIWQQCWRGWVRSLGKMQSCLGILCTIFILLFFFFRLCHVAYRIPDQGSNPCLLHWQRGYLSLVENHWTTREECSRHSWAWALTELLGHLNRFCRVAQMIKFSSETRKSRFWCTWFIKSQIYVFRVPIIWQILLQKVHQQLPAFDQIHLVKLPINVLTKPGTRIIIQRVFFLQWKHTFVES